MAEPLTLDRELGPDLELGPEPEAPAAAGGVRPGGAARWGLRLLAFAYLLFLLILPVGLIFAKTFENGVAPIWEALTSEDAVHAFGVTIVVASWTVVLNTGFGLVASFLLVRHEFPGKRVLDKLIDLPLAVSPVVIGLALLLVYGRETTVGSFLGNQGFDLLYAVPGMVMATCFVSLPLVVREVAPVLEEIGDDQEQAAATLGASPFQTFRRITLPSIRWGLAYGVVLTLARSLGEFGAVAVVSGKIRGETETATLFVERSFDNIDLPAAYAGAVALAAMAVGALLLMNLFRPATADPAEPPGGAARRTRTRMPKALRRRRSKHATTDAAQPPGGAARRTRTRMPKALRRRRSRQEDR